LRFTLADYVDEKGKLDKEKQNALLYSRYKESDEKYVNEQEAWEQHQTNKALLKFGADAKKSAPKDKKTKELEQPVQEDFDFIFDEEQQIEFLRDETIKPILERTDNGPMLTEQEIKGMPCSRSRFQ
jgi:pre-mRNA-splicing factor ATP-dependent RNA helicase DHX16